MLGNFFNNAMKLLGSGAQADSSLDPLYKAITLIGPYALSVVAALGLIYGVIVGVKFAKAETTDERAKMQKILINGIIGFVAVLVLIGVLYAIRGPLVVWMNS